MSSSYQRTFSDYIKIYNYHQSFEKHAIMFQRWVEYCGYISPIYSNKVIVFDNRQLKEASTYLDFDIHQLEDGAANINALISEFISDKIKSIQHDPQLIQQSTQQSLVKFIELFMDNAFPDGIVLPSDITLCSLTEVLAAFQDYDLRINHKLNFLADLEIFLSQTPHSNDKEDIGYAIIKVGDLHWNDLAVFVYNKSSFPNHLICYQIGDDN